MRQLSNVVATLQVVNAFSSNISVAHFFNISEMCCRLVNVIARNNATNLAGDLVYSC